MTIEELMAQPWSWVGPTKVTDQGQTHWELRIRELPDFFVAGETAPEALTEATEALRSFLMSYVEVGEQPPLPLPQPAPHAWQFYVTRYVLRSPLTALFTSLPGAAETRQESSGIEDQSKTRRELVAS